METKTKRLVETNRFAFLLLLNELTFFGGNYTLERSKKVETSFHNVYRINPGMFSLTV